MRAARVLITIAVLSLLGSYPALALDRSLDVGQYGHTAWTARDGFSVGAIFAIAQTPDGYLWLGTEFGLFRFDGLHAVSWQPPAAQQLPNAPNALHVTRDGTPAPSTGQIANLPGGCGKSLPKHEAGNRVTLRPGCEAMGNGR
jgi:ligand-binding sensor domain-containing protein